VKRFLASTAALTLCIALLFHGASIYFNTTMPAYRDSVGDDNYTEKITGLYLVRESAAREDNLIIYGSSELRTLEISTHPSNFFAGKRAGFQVNLVGRGSCQSLIHAISIAATGDALSGKKVVLITSPQSYVEDGIAPDLFMANFSEQQYLELLAAADISEEVKRYISARMVELFDRYKAMPGSSKTDTAVRYLAEYNAQPMPATSIWNAALSPYYGFNRYLYDLKDKVTARSLLESVNDNQISADSSVIDWVKEEQSAITEAVQMTDNNDFGINVVNLAGSGKKADKKH